MDAASSTSSPGLRSARWVPPVALALVVATFVRLGLDGDAAAWAAVQIALVLLAAHDLATHLIPNVITVPGSLLAVLLRVVFDRSDLLEVVIAGAAAFATFFMLALLLRGGLGMGDVKLAGLLGFLLGSAVVPALLIGVVAGGIAGAAMLIGRTATRQSSIAYGPYLALGAAIAILAGQPPSLV